MVQKYAFPLYIHTYLCVGELWSAETGIDGLLWFDLQVSSLASGCQWKNVKLASVCSSRAEDFACGFLNIELKMKCLPLETFASSLVEESSGLCVTFI